jgi:hypothetical protein
VSVSLLEGEKFLKLLVPLFFGNFLVQRFRAAKKSKWEDDDEEEEEDWEIVTKRLDAIRGTYGGRLRFFLEGSADVFRVCG